MKKLILTVAAVALLAPAIAVPTFASAQDRGARPTDRNWGGTPGQYRGQDGGADRAQGGQVYQGGGRDRGPREAPAAAPAPAPAAPAAPAAAQPVPRADRGDRAQGAPGDRGQRYGQGDRGPNGQRFDNNRGQNDRRYDNDRGQNDRRFDDNRGRNDRRFDDNRNGRGFNGDNDRRYDNRGGYARGGGQFSYRGRSYDRFRAQPYRWPGGYRAAGSWRVNQFLPLGFLLRDYYIDNYYDFGFGRPPYGYEWVRVGDDALLVEIRTGRIVDVAPNVFYW